MIIDVNPQTITEIAQTIANAYGEVEEAARILTSITEHNNWNCKERDPIILSTLVNISDIFFSSVVKFSATVFMTFAKFPDFSLIFKISRAFDWV